MSMPLTAVQQDYIETVYNMIEKDIKKGVRVTDIANYLGTRLPTVTRMVRKLTDLGYFRHDSHGPVYLTPKGVTLAGELNHLHTDLVFFFTELLGINKTTADRDAAQLEHGFSPKTAESLHEFLEFYKQLDNRTKKRFKAFKQTQDKKLKTFTHLPRHKTAGWRS